MVTVTAAASWRGIMTRLAGGATAVDTSTVFDLVAGDALLKDNTNCPGTVGGLTHTSRADKTTVSFLLEFTEASAGMALDLSIVQSNPSPSVFFYDQFLIIAVDSSTATPTSITMAPTSAPTLMPTGAPSGAVVTGLAFAMTAWVVAIGALW